MKAESEKPTPYATKCSVCGPVFMTKAFYNDQMMAPDSLWKCARCFKTASWDDRNYESFLDMEERNQP